MAGSFSLPWRLLMLVVYIFILGGINSLLFGEPVPSESKLLVSFVSYLFAILVLQPHFTDLKDSLSNASAAVFVIVPLIFGSDSIRDASRTYWLYALVASIVVLGVTAAVTLLDKSGWQNRLGKLLYFLSSRLGSPKVQFTILHFLILNSFYPEKDDIIWLSLAWIRCFRPTSRSPVWFCSTRLRNMARVQAQGTSDWQSCIQASPPPSDDTGRGGRTS